jgi:opacity protein-like surface antigen
MTTPDGKVSIFSQPGYFRGIPFNVFAGYGGAINPNFYLAGEVFATLATAEISDHNNLKTSYGYGVSVLPGLMLSDHTFGFVRAGLVRTRFPDAGGTETGGLFGAGLQTTVTQNIDVRAEYDYSFYSSFDNVYDKISSPSSDAFNLSLIYKFD